MKHDAGDRRSDLNGGPSEDEVLDYLSRHPDFLQRHPQLLSLLAAPSRPQGEGVADMQAFMIERLRDQLDEMRGCAEGLIATTRDSMASLSRIHRAALAVLAAEGLEQVAEMLGHDLPQLLDVDMVSLAVEVGERAIPELAVPGLKLLPVGAVDRIMGLPGRSVLLLPDGGGDGDVFGEAAATVASAAFVRLAPCSRAPVGLLALGSREEGSFHAGQGSELLCFLARIVERTLGRWLENGE
ncbi:DUF484 family protein [Telmatospirillum sp. J64-1]|uniref:DUF484 family protein n=1 Tax=Telmatospirillum sp. J64-1 TaxID=2502183 RepID=UPI00115F3080|nr:DUF484 family protein [Telmatospirillum sp. J64-1]